MKSVNLIDALQAVMLIASCFAISSIAMSHGQIGAQESDEKKLVVETKFEKGMDGWKVTDDQAWKIKKTDLGNVLSLHKKQSSYKPKVRSPYHIALLEENSFGDFQMDVESAQHSQRLWSP